MKKKIISFVVSSVFAISLLSGCGTTNPSTNPSTNPASGNTSQEDPKLIIVSSVTPLSGSQAAIGESVKNGAQMAFEEQSKDFEALGLTLKYEPQDDQADPKVGASLAQRLVSNKNVLGIVGHFNSGVAIPASEVYKTDNLCMVSPSNTAVAITERNIKSVNRICSRDDVQGPVAAKFAVDELKAKTAFVINDKTTYGKGIAQEFKTAFETNKGKVLGDEGITAGETDFNGLLTKVASQNPDVVFFGGIYPEGGLFIKQMKAKNITAKFIGPDGIDDSNFAKIGGSAVIDSYYTSVASDLAANTKAAVWSKKFETKYGKKPENWSLYGYDAMGVTLAGIKNAIKANANNKPSRIQVTDAVRAIKGYEGLATKVTFNAKGDNEEAGVFIYKYNKAEYPAPSIKSISSKEFLK